jgi:hypothetical protein
MAHTGAASLVGHLRAEAGARDQRRWGAMYEVGLVPFPSRLSLNYRVERWERANATQYLLLAVMVAAGGETYQMRYILAGWDAAPYNSKGNVRFIVVKPGAPPVGQWVHFEADLQRDFQQQWGRVPRNFESLRFAVEVRYEALAGPLEAPIAADVYFDDVFAGWGPAISPGSPDGGRTPGR